MLLVADIGGTTTRLALVGDGGPRDLARRETRASATVADMGALLETFIAQGPGTVQACCLGVPGPVVAGRAEVTNLPWVLDARALSTRLGGRPVFLLNDLEALALGIPALAAKDTALLAPGRSGARGPIAIIAAGTGLGEAGLLWDGVRQVALASEGGHADFAPRNEREIALLRYCLRRAAHVSWERVVSGPGLVRVFEFLRDEEGQTVPAPLVAALAGSDPASAITAAALAGDTPIAGAALELFVALYGAEAGNLALKLRATGGVYLGGGIAPRILAKLEDGTFHAAFTAKGRFAGLLAGMPVHVILDPDVALYGAASHAAARRD